MREYLIISSVGDNSLHREWIDTDRNFDILIIYYGDKDFDTDNIDFFLKRKGEKFHQVKYFINNNLEMIKKYKYIWIPDDDVSISTESINKLFEISDVNDLYLSQPSMSGFYSHEITLKKGNNIRYTNFVEVLAPLFKTEILLNIYDKFDENQSSWGYDFLWPKLLGYPTNKIAIVDQINMIHTRKVGTDYSRFSKNPSIEMKELLEKYNIKYVF
jgi:hypothetical protein